jgi:hypothetical protein
MTTSAVIALTPEALNVLFPERKLCAHFGDHANGVGRNRFILTQDIKDRIREAVQAEVRLKEVAATTARTAVYNVLKSELVSVTQQELEARAAALKAGISKSPAEHQQ